MSIPATQMRPGMIIKHNDQLHLVFSVEHRTPGNLRAFIQAKLKNVRTGAMFVERFRSPDPIDRVKVDEVKMEFLYNDGDDYYFMDEAFEQTMLKRETLGDAVEYLTPNLSHQRELPRWQGGRHRAADVRRDDGDGDRAGHQVGDRVQRDQACEDGDGARGAGAAVHQRRREDSRGYGRRRLHEPRVILTSTQ